MSSELEAQCARCRSVHQEGASRWRCDGCGGEFCWMDLVDGRRWNRRGPIHVGMARGGQFRACGQLIKIAEVKADANEAAAPATPVSGLPEGVRPEEAEPGALPGRV